MDTNTIELAAMRPLACRFRPLFQTMRDACEREPEKMIEAVQAAIYREFGNGLDPYDGYEDYEEIARDIVEGMAASRDWDAFQKKMDGADYDADYGDGPVWSFARGWEHMADSSDGTGFSTRFAVYDTIREALAEAVGHGPDRRTYFSNEKLHDMMGVFSIFPVEASQSILQSVGFGDGGKLSQEDARDIAITLYPGYANQWVPEDPGIPGLDLQACAKEVMAECLDRVAPKYDISPDRLMDKVLFALHQFSTNSVLITGLVNKHFRGGGKLVPGAG